MEQVSRRLFRDGTPVVKMAALGNEEFKVAGEIMVTSVVQGGPAPCFLSNDMFSYVVFGVESIGITYPNDAVEDINLKDAIKKVWQEREGGGGREGGRIKHLMRATMHRYFQIRTNSPVFSSGYV